MNYHTHRQQLAAVIRRARQSGLTNSTIAQALEHAQDVAIDWHYGSGAPIGVRDQAMWRETHLDLVCESISKIWRRTGKACPLCGAYASRCHTDGDDGQTYCAITDRPVNA